MELNGTLSNPEVRVEIPELFSLVTAILARGPRRSKLQKPLPERAGDVKSAVIRAIELADKPLRLTEIHSACEDFLGRQVNYTTVKDCVHKHSRGGSPLFTRVGHGRYLSEKLIREPETLPYGQIVRRQRYPGS